MATLTLNGSTSGAITLAAPAVAGSNTLTLPAATGTLVTSESASISGNLTFTGTGNRITGDFSNVTVANRVNFQTSTTNGNTYVSTIPIGSGSTSGFFAYNNADGDNASFISSYLTSTLSIINSGKNGTGSYLPMTFYTGGSERMRIDTSGNVGIGQSTFVANLEIGKAITGGSTWFGIRQTSTIQSDVTSSVQYNRTVANTAAASFTLGSLWHYTAVQGTFGAGSAVTNQYGFFVDSTLIGATNNYGFYSNIASGTNRYNFYANGTADNYFAGNVGIGTSSPGGKLHVKAATNQNLIVQGSVSLANSVAISAVNDAVNANVPLEFRYGTNTAFIQDGSERMRIDSSGNLLVGITSFPTTAGQTGSGIGPNGQVYLAHAGTSFWTHMNFINSNGSVGSIATNASTTSFNTSSDYRLKENVTPMTTGLARISALKPVTYDWISDNSKGEGFLAHELAEVVPLAVSGEKDAVDAEGNPIYQGVDYSKIVVHLVAAIQELKAENDALNARIAALEAK